MDLTTIIDRSPNATFEVVAEEAILIHLISGVYFSLNKIGTEFWQMLDGKATLQTHADIMAAKYGVDQKMVVADLLELATQMLDEDLIDLK